MGSRYNKSNLVDRMYRLNWLNKANKVTDPVKRKQMLQRKKF